MPGSKTLLGLLAAAAMVATSGFVASAPAQAQPFGNAFGLQFNWNDSFEPRGPRLALCKTDRQIRQAIAARGYSDIALNVKGDRRVQVRASLDGATWLLEYNFCNDTILDRQVLR